MINYHCAHCLNEFKPKWKPKPSKSGLRFCSQNCSISFWAKSRTKSGPTPTSKCISCDAPIKASWKRCKTCRATLLLEKRMDKALVERIKADMPEKLTKFDFKTCLLCLSPISPNSRSSLCKVCFNDSERTRILDTPLKDFLYSNRGETNKYTRFRDFSRRLALKIEPNPKCCVCGYSVYVEVCHIKPVSDFAEDSLVREVNSPTNLTFLCPNHHKELDKHLSDIIPIPISSLVPTGT